MYNGYTGVPNALRDTSQPRPPLGLNRPCADTLYTLTPYPLTLPILPGSWLTNCCFRLNSIVTAFQREEKKHFQKKRGKKEKKKPTQNTHAPVQCSRAGPWLTVSTLFPLVPQSTILSTDNNLSIHSLTFPSFQSTWKTSKKRREKKKLKWPERKPSIAQRNSLFKCKTKISGLFSMPMRLHRKQSSQRTVDRKSFLGIKRHCVLERHGARKRF